jgi:hypothetical protein
VKASVTLGLCVALLSCSSQDTTPRDTTPGSAGAENDAKCAPGSEPCPCYGNGTCNAGLTCASDLCVDLGGLGGSPGGADDAGSPAPPTGGAGGAGPALPEGDCGSYDGGANLGLCVPRAESPPLYTFYWPEDICAAGWVCAAVTKVADYQQPFPRCVGDDESPGACWPRYVLEGLVAGTGSAFASGTCSPDESCMQCANPVDLNVCAD